MPSLTTLLGTIGSWLGSVAAHAIALITVPLLDKVRECFYPPPPPPPHPLLPLIPAIGGLTTAVRITNHEVRTLKGFLVEHLGQPRRSEIARGRRRPANNST